MEVEHKTGFSKGVWTGRGDHSCPQCGRMLPADVPKGEVCDACKEMNLFAEVREYIRTHEVNEFEVAIHFNIPRRKVLSWIKDGRIEYREDEGTKFLARGHCEMCGAPIAFGSLCTRCKRKVEDQKKQGFAIIKPKDEDEKMRFRNRNN